MPKPQKIRIVHDGGPACMAKVYIDGERALGVTRVELDLNAANHEMVTAKLTFINVELDITANDAED